jgi:hypothetical protein
VDPGLELLVALVDAKEQDGEPLQVLAYQQGVFVCGVRTSRELLEELADRGQVNLYTSVKGGETLTVTPEGRRTVKRLREPVPETAVSLGRDQIDRVVRATIECVEHSAKEQVTPAEIAMRLSVEVGGALLLRLRMAASNGLLHEGVSSAGEETYTPTRAALQQHRGWSAGAQELLATRLMEEMVERWTPKSNPSHRTARSARRSRRPEGRSLPSHARPAGPSRRSSRRAACLPETGLELVHDVSSSAPSRVRASSTSGRLFLRRP